jgi:hypothetical protein
MNMQSHSTNHGEDFGLAKHESLCRFKVEHYGYGGRSRRGIRNPPPFDADDERTFSNEHDIAKPRPTTYSIGIVGPRPFIIQQRFSAEIPNSGQIKWVYLEKEARIYDYVVFWGQWRLLAQDGHCGEYPGTCRALRLRDW